MELKYVDNRVINEKGDVAISYVQTVPHTLRVHGRDIAFVVQRNICMAWVNPEDVGVVLATLKRCCGGQHTLGYRLENGGNVRRWLGVSER